MVSLLSGRLPGGKVKPMAVIAPYIISCYESSRFCDLVLITMNNKMIFCHKMVLCSLSKDLREILATCDEDSDPANVHLPECTFQEVKTLVDMIYTSIGDREVEMQKTEVTAVLGINDGRVKRETRALEDEDGELPDVEVEIKAEVSDEDDLWEEEPLKISGKRRGRTKKRKRGRLPKTQIGHSKNGEADNKIRRRLSRMDGRPTRGKYTEDSDDESERGQAEEDPLPAGNIKRESINEQDIFEDVNDGIDAMDYEYDKWQLEDQGAHETFAAAEDENVNPVASGHTVPKKTRKLFGKRVQVSNKKKRGRPRKDPGYEYVPSVSAEELLALEIDPEVLKLQKVFAAEVELWRPKPRLKRKPAKKPKRIKFSEDEEEIPVEPKTRKRGRPSRSHISDSDGENDTPKIRPKRPENVKKPKLETKSDDSEDCNDGNDEEYSPEVGKKVENRNANTSDHPKQAPDPDLLSIVSECRPVRFNVMRLGDDFPVMPLPNRPWAWFNWSQLRKPAFSALVGVARSEEYIDPRILKFNGEMLVGRPLAWSFPNGKEQMEDHYNAVTEAYMNVFGFSEEDVHCNQLFINAAFGGCEKTPVEYRDIKKLALNNFYQEFKGMDDAEMRYLLERRRTERPLADERREKKPTLALKYDRCKLRFDPTLLTENFEGVMLIAWHNNSNTDGHPVGRVLNFDHDLAWEQGQSPAGGRPWIWNEKQPKAASLFVKMLRDVWGNGDDKYRLPFSENMYSRCEQFFRSCLCYQRYLKSSNIPFRYKSVFERALAPRLLQRLLDGDVPERVCPTCGKKFSTVTGKENIRYNCHVATHKVDLSSSCGCKDIAGFDSVLAKERHMKLHHSDGQYVQCPKCVEPILKDELEVHLAAVHIDVCCEHCGRAFDNT